MSAPVLRLGTRGSLLARSQSALVAGQLQMRHAGLRVETVIIKTTGDRITDRPLYDAGGKGLFVKELEEAMLAGAVDFAVHSAKDLPVTMPLVDEAKLQIAAVPRRHDPRDVLISRQAAAIDDLPQSARIGTTSLRRRCQLLARRPDLGIEPLRGNVDTRLKKLRDGQIDAIVLALAGIERAGLMDESWMHPLSIEALLPAPGQGALALQCRRDDARTVSLLKALDDPETHLCLEAERAVVAALHGDCHSPIAVLAQIEGRALHLRAIVGHRGGQPPLIHASARSAGSFDHQQVARDLCQDLKTQGVDDLLREPGTAD